MTQAQERIAKRIARSGLCSRREAERWIEEGKVQVDGKTITSPALNVTAENSIKVNGKLLPEAEKTRIWLYNKPRGLVTTHKDPEGRPTVFAALPKELNHVISVGRLDKNSEGLLLLTNDGALARHLELPETGWSRRYKIRVFRAPTKKTIELLSNGVKVEGIYYAPMTVEIEQSDRTNVWLQVALSEGKNREIRKVFEHFGHPVSRIIRLSYGPFQLGKLPVGGLKEVPQKTIKAQLGNIIS